MHIGSLDKMKKFVDKYLKQHQNEQLTILDVGSQDVNGSYKQFFGSSNWEYTGLDMIPGKNVDIVLKDVYDWTEIQSDSFDVIVTGQVFEHVEFFWVTILEISRVLKEGGICCIIAPSNGVEHRYPVDCWRYYPDGFSALAKYAGLNVLEVYTQWQNVGYPDGSDIWKDSVLVCQKPLLTDEAREARKHKNYLAKLVAGVSADPVKFHEAFKYFSKSLQISLDLKSILSEIEQEIKIHDNMSKLNQFPVEQVVQVINKEISNKTGVFNQIAVTNFTNECYDNVIPYLNAALEIDNSNVDALYNLGFILDKMGESELALTYLSRIENKDEQLLELINKISDGKKKQNAQ